MRGVARDTNTGLLGESPQIDATVVLLTPCLILNVYICDRSKTSVT